MAARGRAFRFSPGVVVLLVIAIAVGAAAALLAPPAGAAPSSNGSPALEHLLTWDGAVVAIWVLLGLMVASLFWNRGSSGSLTPYILHAARAYVVVLVIMVVLVVVFRVFSPQSFIPNGTGPAPGGTGNQTGTSPSKSCTNASDLANCTPAGSGGSGGLGSFTFGALTIAGWVVFVAVIVVAVISVVSVFWALSRRAPSNPATDVTGVRAELKSAIDALDQNPNLDVRTLIIGLYARMLARVDSNLTRPATMSAREIEYETVRFMGVGPTTARELRDLFEEARYSSHTLPSSAADRARTVFSQALADLDRRPRGAA